MPQLDTFTYLSQLFWVFVLFSGFYVLVLSDILPSFSQILKTRKKKLDQNGDNIENLFKEESEAYSQ
jgi:F0F1-type ATP synthase membrane subunit b/b'